MNELRQALLPGEEILFETRKHWMAPFRDSIIAILLVIGGLVLWSLAPPGGEGLFGSIGGMLGTLMWWIGLAIIVIGAAWIVWNIGAWLSANFGVSNQRVLCYEGLLRKHSSETLLSSVTDVKLTVPALGGMFGYGDLTVLTASGADGSDRFRTIRRAAEFRTAIQTAQTGPQTANAAAASPATPIPTPAASAAASPPIMPEPAPAGETGTSAPAVAAAAAQTNDVAASLDKLADLHTRGVITDAEFEAKKAELLGRI